MLRRKEGFLKSCKITDTMVMPLQLLSFDKIPYWQYEYLPPGLAWMGSRIVVKKHTHKTARLQKNMFEQTGARVNMWIGFSVDRTFNQMAGFELLPPMHLGMIKTHQHFGLLYSNGSVCFRLGYTGLKFRRFYRQKWKVPIAKQKRCHENQVRAFIHSQIMRSDGPHAHHKTCLMANRILRNIGT